MASLLLRRMRPLPLRHSLHPTTRLLHVRSVSLFSGIGRLAGRTAGRATLGVGAGVGALTWADWKLEGQCILTSLLAGVLDIAAALQGFEGP